MFSFRVQGRCMCSMWAWDKSAPCCRTACESDCPDCIASIPGGRLCPPLRPIRQAIPPARERADRSRAAESSDRCPPEPTSLAAWKQHKQFSPFLHFKNENAVTQCNDTISCIIKTVYIPPGKENNPESHQSQLLLPLQDFQVVPTIL